MKHSGSTSATLDALEAEMDECGRRSCNGKAKRQQRTRVVSSGDTFRFAELKSQDPSEFAHLLADHFVAREASNAASMALTSPTAPAKQQQLTRPVAGAVSLGSFRSWQFGERCLATYRVLFGRPLWAPTTPTSLSTASPRPRKRKHVTPPTSSSSEGSDGGADQMDTFEMESTEELLSLPTVDELLELPTDDTFDLDDKEEEVPLGADDVLISLAIELDQGQGDDVVAGGDAIDLLWDLDASEVDGGAMLTGGEEEELRFLDTAPSSFPPVTSGGDDMEDI